MRLACLAVVGCLLAGCGGRGASSSLVVSGAHYQPAFDAAVEAAREAGMPAVLRDRRNGVIETDPVVTGSLLEPWLWGRGGGGRAVEGTVGMERRRARIEFAPVVVAAESNARTSSWEGGDDLLAVSGEGRRIAMNVVVTVERAQRPGLRRDDWTRSKTTTARIINAAGENESELFWEVVGRDEAVEAWLVRQVEKRAGEPGRPDNGGQTE